MKPFPWCCCTTGATTSRKKILLMLVVPKEPKPPKAPEPQVQKTSDGFTVIMTHNRQRRASCPY